MSVFSRREIKKRLDSLSTFISEGKLKRLIDTINTESSEKNEKRLLEHLAGVWEITIISAFGDIGTTKYEEKISNGKKPDILFCDHGISLLAEVVTVSDDQQHKKNPVEEFRNIISKFWVDYGLKTGIISHNVEAIDIDLPIAPQTSGLHWPLHLSSRLRPISRAPIRRLMLPPLSDLDEYLHKKFLPFFDELIAAPNIGHELSVNEQYSPEIRVCFTIRYAPSDRAEIYGSHLSYTAATDIESHVLWRRLLEKSKQFDSATENFPRILFVCDGGCEVLTNNLGGVPEYRRDEIIGHFWRRPQFSGQGQSWLIEQGISAIIVLAIEPKRPPLFGPDPREFLLKCELYTNPYCYFPVGKTDIELLNKVLSRLPVPIESPANVLRSISKDPGSTRRLGVFRTKGDAMGTSGVEMSGVELLKILAGELSPDEFCREHGLPFNPFKEALKQSKTVKSIRVEPVASRDDDKVIMEFGYDVANGPFRAPSGG